MYRKCLLLYETFLVSVYNYFVEKNVAMFLKLLVCVRFYAAVFVWVEFPFCGPN